MPRCSLQLPDVCVGLRDVISGFNSEIEGLLVFCACVLFYALCVLEVVYLAFRMLSLSAWRYMFLMMVFAVCISGGG